MNSFFKNTSNSNAVVQFPFAAILGQDELKLALILNVIEPRIGGVMVMGDRGTGKSTTIRSFADLLPELCILKNDPFNLEIDTNSKKKEIAFENVEKDKFELIRMPMIELPLGATEEKVCGAIDLKEVLSGGKSHFDPGLLARANRGILYVDEINLLDDHLVDVLLDSAASGWNTVEREGISIKHPAKFILIGSGNPEEGELRPQLLDRFGMHVEMRTIQDSEMRNIAVNSRIQFDENPHEFQARYEAKHDALRNSIAAAKSILPSSDMAVDYAFKISEVCGNLAIDGLRGDLVCIRAAKALAAFEGRSLVSRSDIERTITLCLRHRLHKDPKNSIEGNYYADKIMENFREVFY